MREQVHRVRYPVIVRRMASHGGSTWYLQLSCPSGQSAPCINTARAGAARVFDIDGFDNPTGTVAALHAQGARVVCYLDGGTWEDWRPDAARFPATVKGHGNGWPGEKWLDVRQLSILGPIMSQRAQSCKAKGFDAIDWDNLDGYSTARGFHSPTRIN